MTTLLDRHGIRELPLEERIQLLDELYENVEAESPEALMEPEFAAELDCRSDELDAHPEIGIPYQVALQRISESLRQCHGN